MSKQTVVIGGGNMGRALVRGGLAAGILRAAEVVVVDPDESCRRACEAMGVRTAARVAEVISGPAAVAAWVVLAVKPQSLGAVAGELRGLVPGEWGVVSILAGTPISKLSGALGRMETGGIIRAMPNTAVAVRAGMTALSDGPGVSAEQSAWATRLFGSLGEVVRIDESLMDAFTALAGSGPAYVYRLAESMSRAGVEAGFEAATSARIVRQTIIGAAALMSAEPSRSAAELRAAVTSKGGTTEAALGVLGERGVEEAVVAAVLRARDRGRELAG